MVQFGYTLLCEQRSPRDLVADARTAEDAGFDAGWPAAATRHELPMEAIDIMRHLWSGGYQSHDGGYFTVEDARIYSLPERPPLGPDQEGFQRFWSEQARPHLEARAAAR